MKKLHRITIILEENIFNEILNLKEDSLKKNYFYTEIIKKGLKVIKNEKLSK
jgi:hypothetical protein